MRKRIFITLIAVVVIGAVAFFVSELSGPKRGTVEWHKREFQDARRLTWIGTILRRCPARLRHAYVESKYKRWLFHRQALIDGGYFEEKTFIVSNSPREVALTLYAFVSTNTFAEVPMIDIGSSRALWTNRYAMIRVGSNTVTIVAQPNQMGRFEELLRQADVPESGK